MKRIVEVILALVLLLGMVMPLSPDGGGPFPTPACPPGPSVCPTAQDLPK